jgi:hypothetical protein
MSSTSERSLLERIATVLAPMSVIIKVLFDFVVLLHTGH